MKREYAKTGVKVITLERIKDEFFKKEGYYPKEETAKIIYQLKEAHKKSTCLSRDKKETCF